MGSSQSYRSTTILLTLLQLITLIKKSSSSSPSFSYRDNNIASSNSDSISDSDSNYDYNHSTKLCAIANFLSLTDTSSYKNLKCESRNSYDDAKLPVVKELVDLCEPSHSFANNLIRLNACSLLLALSDCSIDHFGEFRNYAHNAELLEYYQLLASPLAVSRYAGLVNELSLNYTYKASDYSRDDDDDNNNDDKTIYNKKIINPTYTSSHYNVDPLFISSIELSSGIRFSQPPPTSSKNSTTQPTSKQEIDDFYIQDFSSTSLNNKMQDPKQSIIQSHISSVLGEANGNNPLMSLMVMHHRLIHLYGFMKAKSSDFESVLPDLEFDKSTYHPPNPSHDDVGEKLTSKSMQLTSQLASKLAHKISPSQSTQAKVSSSATCNQALPYIEAASNLVIDQLLTDPMTLYGRLNPAGIRGVRYSGLFVKPSPSSEGAAGRISSSKRSIVNSPIKEQPNPPSMIEYFRDMALTFHHELTPQEKHSHPERFVLNYPYNKPRGNRPTSSQSAVNAAMSLGTLHKTGSYKVLTDLRSDECNHNPRGKACRISSDVVGINGRDLFEAVRYFNVACDLGSLEGCGEAGLIMLLLKSGDEAAKSSSGRSFSSEYDDDEDEDEDVDSDDSDRIGRRVGSDFVLPKWYTVDLAIQVLREGAPLAIYPDENGYVDITSDSDTQAKLPLSAHGCLHANKLKQCSEVSLNGLGLAFLYGLGVPRHVGIATRLFRISGIDGGNYADGAFNYGMMLVGYMRSDESENRFITTQNYEEAGKAFFKASTGGHILALHRLAVMNKINGKKTQATVGTNTNTGDYASTSCNLSIQNFQTVVNVGSTQISRMGLEAYDSFVHGEYSRSLELNLRLAEMGIDSGQVNAGWMLEHGIGVPIGMNIVEFKTASLRYWKASATASLKNTKQLPGSSADAKNVGGGGGEGWIKVGDFQYYNVIESAWNDLSNGESEDGVGVVNGIVRAIRGTGVLEFITSLVNNNTSQSTPSPPPPPPPQTNEPKNDGNSNFKAAYQSYQHASQTSLPHSTHHSQSLYNLGYMHQHGYGVPQDFPLAKRYYDLAFAEKEGGGILVLWWLGVHERFVMTRIWLDGIFFGKKEVEVEKEKEVGGVESGGGKDEQAKNMKSTKNMAKTSNERQEKEAETKKQRWGQKPHKQSRNSNSKRRSSSSSQYANSSIYVLVSHLFSWDTWLIVLLCGFWSVVYNYRLWERREIE